MKIEFELENKEYVLIYGIDEKGNKKKIGHIFTPSGSGKINLNAIQICGFDEAFDLWGCGVFGDKKTKQMKKDIQLCWFRPYDKMEGRDLDFIEDIGIGDLTCRRSRVGSVIDGKLCGKCFNRPCNCEVLINHENPFAVKREQDLWLEKKKVEDKKSSSTQRLNETTEAQGR